MYRLAMQMVKEWLWTIVFQGVDKSFSLFLAPDFEVATLFKICPCVLRNPGEIEISLGRCRSVVVSEVDLFAPATMKVPIEILIRNFDRYLHGRRSKLLQRQYLRLSPSLSLSLH